MSLAHDFFEFNVLDENDNRFLWKQELEIIFILEGTGRLYLENEPGSYSIVKSDIFVIESFVMRKLELDSGSLAIALSLSSQFVVESNPETSTPSFECKSFLYSDTEQETFNALRKDFSKAFQSYYKKESDLSVVMRSKCLNLLSTLYRYFLKENNDGRKQQGRQRLGDTINYIHNNFKEDLTLGDLADISNLSPSYLSRIFKENIGLTITDYIALTRLEYAKSLFFQNKTLTEITYESGFSNSNAMINTFKQFENKTPTQVREEMLRDNKKLVNERNRDINVDGFYTAFESLVETYRDDEIKIEQQEVIEVFLNAKKETYPTSDAWRQIMNVGYAKDILNEPYQKQIQEIQTIVGYRYLRVKGVLDDDMFAYVGGFTGEVIKSYVYMEEVIDFILSVGAKPIIELSHMPSLLAKSEGLKIRQLGVIAPPKDYDIWYDIIFDFISHLTERYGEEEIRSWIFSPWVAPDYYQFANFKLEEYQNTYIRSYQAIKDVSKMYQVCGPGSDINNKEVFTWFLEMSQEAKCLPDIISLKSFGSIHPNSSAESLQLVLKEDAFPFAVSEDEHYLSKGYQEIYAILDRFGIAQLEIMIEEWSNNIWQRDLCNDTTFKASYIFKNVFENSGNYSALAYYSLNDELGETAPSPKILPGGFGLYTREGLKKSAFYAIDLLSRMGCEVVANAPGYFVTKNKDTFQIYLYNYVHYDLLYRYRHTTNLSRTNRYDVFNNPSYLSYHFQITGLQAGNYQVLRYKVNKDNGSVFDQWLKIGAPEHINTEEIKYLNSRSLPGYKRETFTVCDSLNIKASLEPHAIELIEIKLE